MGEPSLREWLDGASSRQHDDDEAAAAAEAVGSGRRRLWPLAALAWAVVAGMALVLLRASAPAPADRPAGDDDSATPAAVESTDAPRAAGAHPAPAVTPPPEAASTWHPAEPVAAVATVAVRLAMTTSEPDGSARYVDLAVPSAVTWHGEVAVVTVDAVVLDGDGDGWRSPRPARFGQAVLAEPDTPPRPLGQPWALDPPAEAEPLVLEPLDDPGAAADAAARLASAGYAEAEVTGVARLTHAPGVLVVTALARAPGEAAATTHHVWLAGRDGTVLGASRTSGPSPSQEEEP